MALKGLPFRFPWELWGFRGTQVCFSGSVLLESFDIEVVSYDGNLFAKVEDEHNVKILDADL